MTERSYIIRYAHLMRDNKEKAKLRAGQELRPGHYLGEMGGSPYIYVKEPGKTRKTNKKKILGKSYYSPHLHIDCRAVSIGDPMAASYMWRLRETKTEEFKRLIDHNSKLVLDEIINGGPFRTLMLDKAPPHEPQEDDKGRLYVPGAYTITTRYMCPEYEAKYGVPHPAYDLIPHPVEPPWDVIWSGPSPATVVATGYDQINGRGGYGNYVLLLYNRKEA